jgi:O-antigen ligase
VSGAVLTALIGISGGSSAETVTSYGGTTRLSGSIDDPNFLAAILVPALVLAGFLIAAERSPIARWVLATSAAILVVALFLTQSRGGLVGLAVAAVAGVSLAGRLRSRALVAILTTAAATIVYYTLIAPPVMLARMSAFSSGGGTGRLDLWHIALVMYRKHPFGGVGIGNFQILEPRYANAGFNISRIDLVLDNPRVVHNTYLHVLVELGAIGFTAFVLLVLTTVFLGIRYANLLSYVGDWRSELYARGLVVAMISTLAADFFLSAQYDKRFWLLLGAVAAIRSMTFDVESGTARNARAGTEAGAVAFDSERTG